MASLFSNINIGEDKSNDPRYQKVMLKNRFSGWFWNGCYELADDSRRIPPRQEEAQDERVFDLDLGVDRRESTNTPSTRRVLVLDPAKLEKARSDTRKVLRRIGHEIPDYLL